MIRFLVAVSVVLVMPAAASAQGKDKIYTVRATVASGLGPIRAKLQPGEFKVPAGKTAVHTSCFRRDPKSGWSSKKPCTVYSVTAKQYMKDNKGNPITQLPPGTYRFAVGGAPGASGSYHYKLVP